MAAFGVVPGFDPFEHGSGELVAVVPGVLVEELALQDREERFGHGIVVGVADASHRSEDPSGGLPASFASEGRTKTDERDLRRFWVLAALASAATIVAAMAGLVLGIADPDSGSTGDGVFRAVAAAGGLAAAHPIE